MVLPPLWPGINAKAKTNILAHAAVPPMTLKIWSKLPSSS